MGYHWVFFYPADGKLPVMIFVIYESVPVQKPEFLDGDDNVQSIDLSILLLKLISHPDYLMEK